MNARVALVIAFVALGVAVASLAVASHHPASAYPLVCGETFRDAQTGVQMPVYVPCSPTHP